MTPSPEASQAVKEIAERVIRYQHTCEDGIHCVEPKPNGRFVTYDDYMYLAKIAEEQRRAGALTFEALRVANLSRCSRWHPRGLSEWSLSDWGIATAGEMGEALNIIKKLNRERDGIAGNTLSESQLKTELADELADVAIYLDILAASQNIDLAASIVSKFNRTSEKVGFPERLLPAPVGGSEK